MMDESTHDIQFYRAAIGAFVINEFKELLITHNFNQNNNWKVPIGGIKKGESDLNALQRKLDEDMGEVNYKVIQKSSIAHIYRLSQDFIDQEEINYIGQAQRFYWVFISKLEQLRIPNDEVEKYRWIKIDSEIIHKYFGVHDNDSTYSKLIPLEFNQIVDQIPKN